MMKSNPKWKIEVWLKETVEEKIRSIREGDEALKKMRSLNNKNLRKKKSGGKSLEKAQQVQKKWEKSKEEEQEKKFENLRLLKMQSFALKTVKISDKQLKFHKNKN